MEHGDYEVDVLRQAYRRGDNPPDIFADAPELRLDLLPFWKAYDELSTCRGYAGMSGVPLQIPWTAIDAYAIRHKFTGEMYDDLVDIIREVDKAFVKQAAEKAQEGNGNSE
jgi:hypothetical protein